MKLSLVILAYLSLFALAFIDNLRGPYFPELLQDLRLSDTEGGWFFAMASAWAFLASWWTRHLLLRWNSAKTLSLGVGVAGLASLTFSLATDLLSLLIYSGLYGIGYGLISVAMNVAVADGSPFEWRRRILSGLHSVYGLASFCSPLLVTVLEHYGFSWRQGFIVGACPAALVGIYIFFWFPKKQFSMAATEPAPSVVLKPVLTSESKFWALWMGFAVAVYLFGELSLSTRLVLYLVRSNGWSVSHASLYLSGFFGCLFMSRVSLLFIKSTWSSLRWFYVCLCSSVLMFTLGLLLHPLFLSLCGLSMGPFVPSAIDHLMQTFSSLRSEVIAYTMAFFSLVVVVLHFSLGWVTEIASIDVALWMGPAGMCICGLMYGWGLRHVKRAQV